MTMAGDGLNAKSNVDTRRQHRACPVLSGLDSRAGRNCWRVARAKRAAPLIDAAAYFSALADTMRRARKQILICGWDVHALTRLEPAAAGAENLRDLSLNPLR
jgi:hypothetical protein